MFQWKQWNSHFQSLFIHRTHGNNVILTVQKFNFMLKSLKVTGINFNFDFIY